MRRFLCLWFRYWPTDRWRRQRADAPAGPLALTARGQGPLTAFRKSGAPRRGQGGIRLTAVDARAAGLGLAPGMTLAAARALLPELAAADAEQAADAAALVQLADWCRRYGPWSAVDGDDGIRLDITGCAHLFGGETTLLSDAETRLSRFGFAVQSAIADTPAAAWAWARHRPPDAAPVLAPGDAASLRALPAAALRLEAETVQSLARLGLRTIGQIAALPRAPLVKRLGAEPILRLDRMFGRLAESISPGKPVEPWLARLVFAEPIGTREDIDRATLLLMERLCADLARGGLGVRRLELSFFRVDGSVQRIAIGTSRPNRAVTHLVRLFAERLDIVDPGFGIEAMVLDAVVAERILPLQAGLDGAGAGGDPATLVDRLQNRLGQDRVHQLAPVESHVPERAERLVPALSPRPSAMTRAPRALRPVKLFAHPEPIEAMAPIPDDPPLSFRWRRKLHRVVRADGPERIGPEWWRPACGRARDYYRIEDGEGRRFWVYREGLYGAADPPRWFLHGFFA